MVREEHPEHTRGIHHMPVAQRSLTSNAEHLAENLAVA